MERKKDLESPNKITLKPLFIKGDPAFAYLVDHKDGVRKHLPCIIITITPYNSRAFNYYVSVPSVGNYYVFEDLLTFRTV